MNETDVAQVLTGDWEASFPRHYQIKAFLADAGRLRDLARKRTREPLSEAEAAEVTRAAAADKEGRCRRSDGAGYRGPVEGRASILLTSPRGWPRTPPIKTVVVRPGNGGDRGFHHAQGPSPVLAVNPMSDLIAIIPKNNIDEIRVMWSEYKGRRYLDIRVYT